MRKYNVPIKSGPHNNQILLTSCNPVGVKFCSLPLICTRMWFIFGLLISDNTIKTLNASQETGSHSLTHIHLNRPHCLNLRLRPFGGLFYICPVFIHLLQTDINPHPTPPATPPAPPTPPKGSGIFRACFQSWNGKVRAKPVSRAAALSSFTTPWLFLSFLLCF